MREKLFKISNKSIYFLYFYWYEILDCSHTRTLLSRDFSWVYRPQTLISVWYELYVVFDKTPIVLHRHEHRHSDTHTYYIIYSTCILIMLVVMMMMMMIIKFLSFWLLDFTHNTFRHQTKYFKIFNWFHFFSSSVLTGKIYFHFFVVDEITSLI